MTDRWGDRAELIRDLNLAGVMVTIQDDGCQMTITVNGRTYTLAATYDDSCIEVTKTDLEQP